VGGEEVEEHGSFDLGEDPRKPLKWKEKVDADDLEGQEDSHRNAKTSSKTPSMTMDDVVWWNSEKKTRWR
jgi:hypothetical protein